jgi:hypothetical protein
MSYQPQPGDYGIVKTNGIIGRLIRIGTTSRWNHAFIYVGEGVIVEANPTGVALSPVAKYPRIAWNHHEELTDEQRKIIVDTAVDQVGLPYDFMDIVALLLRIFGLKVPIYKLFKVLARRKSWFCSELVTHCYNKANLKLINSPEYLVTPGDLAERLVYQ